MIKLDREDSSGLQYYSFFFLERLFALTVFNVLFCCL